MAIAESDVIEQRAAKIARYQHLTGVVMPELARKRARDWPVVNDHCFQRIVLDAVCQGVWYGHIARPAYKNMSLDQASAAVALCEAILDGSKNLTDLNRQSLRWRGKLHVG